MTKTELIAIMAAVLRSGAKSRFVATQEAYEIHDAVDAIEQDVNRRRGTCFNCAGTGRVRTGRSSLTMPCPYCSFPEPAPEKTNETPADTSSKGRFPGELQPTWTQGLKSIRGPSGIEHQPTCNAVLAADESKCNCINRAQTRVNPK